MWYGFVPNLWMKLVAILVLVLFSNDWIALQILKWILYSRKPYFWHHDYKNQLISYWVMATSSILAVHMAAICKDAN